MNAAEIYNIVKDWSKEAWPNKMIWRPSVDEEEERSYWATEGDMPYCVEDSIAELGKVKP